MPTTKRRITLTFCDDRTLGILGIDPVNQGAAEVWSVLALTARSVEVAGRRLERALSREEWGLIGDALRDRVGTAAFLDRSTPLAILIAAEVQEAHAAAGLGDDWFGGPGAGDDGVIRLTRRLRAMGHSEALAILAAVRFLRDHPESAGEDWFSIKSRLATNGSEQRG